MIRHFALLVTVLAAPSVGAATVYSHAAAATAHPLATAAAVEMLDAGGNAVDAAVAAAFALGVVEPHASGLGGGGLMVILNAETGELETINYRETAPAATNLCLYQDENGAFERERTRHGPLAVAVPGNPAGLSAAHTRHGALPGARPLEPAIRHAEAGFELSGKVAGIYLDRLDLIDADPGLSALLAPEGLPLEAGDTLRQPALAETLHALAASGPAWFYTGPVGEELVNVMAERGGVITADDLATCEPLIGDPLRFTYRDHTIVTVGPPSAGAVTLARTLRALEDHDLAALGPNTPEAIDLIASALSEAAAAVRPMVGDPMTMPSGLELETLMTPAPLSVEALHAPPTSGSTTHLCVIDAAGNAVALTQTLNLWLGAGIVLPESGVMLNDEMADFTYPTSGLWRDDGGNHPTPGARPATSMAPMLVLDEDGEVVAVLGTPGGVRIPSALTEILVNLLDHGMDVEAAVNAPRFHPTHPGGRELNIERDVGAEVLDALRARGWELHERPPLDAHFGGAQVLVRDPAACAIRGAADPRRDGTVDGL